LATPVRREGNQMAKRTEAVVVGGGVMGTSIVYNLVARGVTAPVMLERDTLGSGSTGRSSGLIRMHYSTKVSAALSWKSFPYFLHFDELVGGESPQFIETGFMAIAGPEAAEGLHHNVALEQAIGIDTEMIDLQTAKELAPAFEFSEDEVIAWEPQSGHGDPSGTAMAYAARARELGAEVVLESPATKVVVEGDRVVAVETATERYETDVAVLATGPWSPQVLGDLGIDLPLECTRHEVFLIRRDTAIIPTHPGGVDISNLTYFRPEGGDLTLVGNGNREHSTDPDGYNQKPSMDYLEEVWLRLARRIPKIADGEYFTGYAGLYTSTPDTHPIIDRIDGITGLYVCTGFSGHGFKLAPAVGICMAELILDGKSSFVDIHALRASRFAEGDYNKLSYDFRVIA
jgi:glycine/D-amino acid oxidase-like deaminating enzyme